MLPAHDITQFLQVGRREITVVSVTSLDVFVNAVQIKCVKVHQLLLWKKGEN